MTSMRRKRRHRMSGRDTGSQLGQWLQASRSRSSSVSTTRYRMASRHRLADGNNPGRFQSEQGVGLQRAQRCR